VITKAITAAQPATVDDPSVRTGVNQHLVHAVEPVVDAVELMVDLVEALVNLVEATIDLVAKVIQPLIGPTLSHLVHGPRL
jgi:hypothetical protein